jgi:hypothetical protein
MVITKSHPRLAFVITVGDQGMPGVKALRALMTLRRTLTDRQRPQ